MKFKKNPFHDRIQIEEKKQSNGKKYSVRENRDRHFFPDEWKCFFDCLKAKQKITFLFLINTGARINEARNVKVMDIDMERENVVLRWTKSRNKDGSRRIRTIPISKQFTKYLRSIIKQYKLSQDDYLPILSTPAANIGMKKALVKAKIPDQRMFSVHNVRKTLETWLLALGIDSLKISKHFGHSIVMAGRHYVSPDIFNWDDKNQMREIIGDLYLR